MRALPRLLSTFALVAVLLTTGAAHTFAQQPGSAFTSETIDPGLVVSDVKKSVAFYSEAIGMTEVKGFTVPASWTKDVGLTDGKALDIYVLVLGEGKSATRLKLMEVPGSNARPDDPYITSQQGIRYLTIQVADIDQALQRLSKAGVKPVTGSGLVALPEGFPKDIYLTLVRDPDGNFIELVGPKKQQ